MVKLSDSITIRGMEVKNRLGFAPMLTSSSDLEGRPTEKTYRAYEQKARGGAGLITYEAAMVDPWLRGTTSAVIGRDENMPAYRKMTELVHQYDVKFGMQLNKLGLITYTIASQYGFFGFPVIGPSKVDMIHSTSGFAELSPTWATTIKERKLEIKELSVKEIETIQEHFAAGAKRAIDVGFDFVEIHSAHGTLPSAFLTPYNNKRTDKYGGSLEKRCQFITELVPKVRKSIGEIPPILVRISGDELVDDGNKIEDTIKIAKILEKIGVDCIDVSQGVILRSPYGIEIPSYVERGSYIHLAEAIKEVVNVPVIGVGGINDPRMADRFIQEGKADIIYMGRQIYCDSETPNKYFNNQLDDIKHCIGCLQSCRSVCIYDAYSGQNYQELIPSTEKKKIIILGGGIAGLEAARVSKLRGHEVELFEKSDKIGGLIPLVAKEYKKEEFMNIVNYLEIQLKKLQVPIHLNQELTKEGISRLNPDILVIATGTEATLPTKFKDNPNVITQDEAILKTKELGKNIVVWGLNAYWKGGLETVLTLNEEGYNVKALMGSNTTVGSLIIQNISRRLWILQYLKKNKIPVYSKAKLMDVTKEGVRFFDADKKEIFIEADSLIYCGSRVSEGKKIKKALEGVAPEIVLIGDCKRPRDVQAALTDAQNFARNLK